MATYLKTDGLTIARADQLRMYGLQTDAHGDVLGGHEILFDPSLPGQPDSYAVSDEGQNMITGKAPLICQGTFASGIGAAGGLQFTTASGIERFELQGAADLVSLGDGASAVISVWVTTAASGQTTDWSAIAGYARQTSTYNQWGISYQGSTGEYDMRFCGQAVQAAPDVGNPELLTIFVDGRGNFAKTGFYQGSTRLGEARYQYPLIDPADSGVSPLYPALGFMSGFAQGWVGTLHRFQLFEVDPLVFDIDEWLASEIAANGGRW